ncbi:hypothetical protein [Hugenholtzia roseola]|uniref:hypothetical protein n=1 Tax=Hugenholtzia roseola TaxID=1002 RepID=UPI0004034C9B|nr:hypothetical protein [Hugenholtzia roseola]
MKRYLLFLTFFLLACFSLSAQVIKFKTQDFSYREKNSGTWTDWSPYQKLSVLGTIDMDNNRIELHAERKQVYDVIEYLGESQDSDGDSVMGWSCLNQNGVECRIRFVKLNSQGGRLQLYVDFEEIGLAYNLYIL